MTISLDAFGTCCWKPPFTVAMALVGMLFAGFFFYPIETKNDEFTSSLESWMHVPADVILFIFLPPLLFDAAFNVKFHVFVKCVPNKPLDEAARTLPLRVCAHFCPVLRSFLFQVLFVYILCFHACRFPLKASNPLNRCLHLRVESTPRVLPSSLLLAAPGVLLSTFLTALFFQLFFATKWIFGGNLNHDALEEVGFAWGWQWSLVTGTILSATDPVAVTAVLHDLGAPEKLATMIEGESLLNDGTAMVPWARSVWVRSCGDCVEMCMCVCVCVCVCFS